MPLVILILALAGMALAHLYGRTYMELQLLKPAPEQEKINTTDQKVYTGRILD